MQINRGNPHSAAHRINRVERLKLTAGMVIQLCKRNHGPYRVRRNTADICVDRVLIVKADETSVPDQYIKDKYGMAKDQGMEISLVRLSSQVRPLFRRTSRLLTTMEFTLSTLPVSMSSGAKLPTELITYGILSRVPK